MGERRCSVEGCEKQTRTGRCEWCDKHYLRWLKYGDPETLLPTYTVCEVDDCTRVPRSTRCPLCEMHYYRRRRHGSPDVVIDTRRPDATYRAAHARVTHDQGPARNQPCIDCDVPAHHWSYDHADPNELVAAGGQAYSLETGHYDARCAPCHARFDGTGRNQYSRR